MIRLALTGLLLLVLAACTREPLPPPSFENPILGANGKLSGVVGVDGRHWQLIDMDLRRSIYWQSLLRSLTVDCQVVYPEHEDWLKEVNGLLKRANDKATKAALALELARLRKIAVGADRAIVALNAMQVATVDVAAIAQGWIKLAANKEVSSDEAWIHACSLLFGKEDLRGLMRSGSQPLHNYLVRMKKAQPRLYARQPRIDVLVERLGRI